jgi:membrane protein implicated in regulation of membrane protease activity
MVWWIWVLVALVLLGVEMATPGGFVAIFFGIGALLAGLLAAAGLAGSLGSQMLLFSIFSVSSLVLLRRPVRRWFEPTLPAGTVDRLDGERGIILEAIAPGGVGRVEVRGSSWGARSAAPASLKQGERCIVERVDGLTLWVRPE